MQCSQCDNPNITKLSMVYESGTAHTSSAHRGAVVGVAGGGLGYGVTAGTTKSVTRTTNALKAAPPAKHRYGGWFVGIFFGFLICAFGNFMTIVGLLVIGFSIFRIYKQVTWNRTQWPVLFDRWNRLYQCNRCSEVMIPIRNAVIHDVPHIDGARNVQLPNG